MHGGPAPPRSQPSTAGPTCALGVPAFSSLGNTPWRAAFSALTPQNWLSVTPPAWTERVTESQDSPTGFQIPDERHHLDDINQWQKFPMPPVNEERYVDDDDFQLGSCMVATGTERLSARGTAVCDTAVKTVEKGDSENVGTVRTAQYFLAAILSRFGGIIDSAQYCTRAAKKKIPEHFKDYYSIQL